MLASRVAKIAFLKAAEPGQSLEIENCHVQAVNRYQPGVAQRSKRAVDVNRGQPDRIADELLGQRHLEGHAFDESCGLQTKEQFKQQVPYSLACGSPGGIDQMLSQN